MSYSEQLKEKETTLTNLKAQALAKKKTLEELVEKRKLLEEDCKSKFGISLAEVPDKLASLKKDIDAINDELEEEVEAIELEFAKIK